MQKYFIILISLITLGFISCTTKNKNSEDGTITYVEDNDRKMNAAMDKARETFGQFEKAFIENQTTGNYSLFVVKEAFPTKDGSKEHMWINELTFDGTNFTGILVNEPMQDVDVKYGDTIVIDRNLISDWVYVDSTNLAYGGYTVRVFMDRMSDGEKTAFQKENGYEFAPLAE